MAASKRQETQVKLRVEHAELDAAHWEAHADWRPSVLFCIW